ncbi:hypothetical protein ACFLTJ_00695 [Chloroflexota bacterium]
MAEYDVIDDAIIYAKPDVVYEALLAEYSGKTNWWVPHVEAKPREGGAVDQPGALIDLTVYHRGTTKFSVKTIETKKNELWHLQYVEGDFRGKGIRKLKAIDGNTKVSYHWHCRPSRLLRILAPFINIPRGHSEVMKLGFAGLNEYIKKRGES